MYEDEYFAYLEKEKKKKPNTIEAYKRDISDFKKYLSYDIIYANKTDILGYLLKLKQDGKTAATIGRKISGLRRFFLFLLEKGYINENPAVDIKAPKAKDSKLEYLSVEETFTLLDAPDESSFGIRDKAILELMYATGMRVNELIEAKVSDINLSMGFMQFGGNYGKARIVPIGSKAKEALEIYIEKVRSIFLKNESDILFLNYRGTGLTRQGLWKILKNYGEKAEIGEKMSPHILRASFAVHMAQNGADIRSLQELMGHEDIKATEIYMNVARPKIKEVYDRTHPRA